MESEYDANGEWVAGVGAPLGETPESLCELRELAFVRLVPKAKHGLIPRMMGGEWL